MPGEEGHDRGGVEVKAPRVNDKCVAQRKERARIRSDKGIRWGGSPHAPAA